MEKLPFGGGAGEQLGEWARCRVESAVWDSPGGWATLASKGPCPGGLKPGLVQWWGQRGCRGKRDLMPRYRDRAF